MRFSLLLYPLVLFAVTWLIHDPHWWVYSTGVTGLSWALAAVRMGPRRLRQVLGLITPDDPRLTPWEVYALNGWPGDSAEAEWLRTRTYGVSHPLSAAPNDPDTSGRS